MQPKPQPFLFLFVVTASTSGRAEYEAKGFYETAAPQKATSPLSHTNLRADRFFHCSPDTKTHSSQHTRETASSSPFFLPEPKDLPAPRRGILLSSFKEGGINLP